MPPPQVAKAGRELLDDWCVIPAPRAMREHEARPRPRRLEQQRGNRVRVVDPQLQLLRPNGGHIAKLLSFSSQQPLFHPAA
jgi:hypothetical protein